MDEGSGFSFDWVDGCAYRLTIAFVGRCCTMLTTFMVTAASRRHTISNASRATTPHPGRASKSTSLHAIRVNDRSAGKAASPVIPVLVTKFDDVAFDFFGSLLISIVSIIYLP